MQWHVIAVVIGLAQVMAIDLSDEGPTKVKQPSVKQPSIDKLPLTTLPTLPLLSNAAPIDSIRRHYLMLEDDLWQLIYSGIDTTYVLERIHTGHLALFDEQFSARNVSFDEYGADLKFPLVQAVAEINRIASMVLDNVLHRNPLAYDESATINVARHQMNITHQIATLYGIGTLEFFESIKNVSEFRINGFA